MPDIKALNAAYNSQAVGNQLVQGLPNGNSGQSGRSASLKDDFSNIIDQTAMSILASGQLSQSASRPVFEMKQDGSAAPVDKAQKASQARGNDYSSQSAAYRAQSVANGSGSGNAPDSQAVAKAAEEAAGEVSDEIEEAFGVSEEEVANALEALGLTQADLLTPEGITAVVSYLVGGEGGDLLTNPEFYAGLQEVQQAAAEIVSDAEEGLGLESGEFLTALSNALEAAADAGEADAAAEEDPLATLKEEPQAEPEAQTLTQDEASLQAKAIMDARDEAQGQGGQAAGRNANAESGQEAHGAQNALGGTAQFFDAMAGAQAGGAVSFAGTTAYAEAADVVRQVVSYIRSQVTADTSSLEMQLVPQSLGRLTVTLQAMQNGEMAARFIAQNETVKAALENQMPQLIERFEEQGVKVNEVQVTIAERGYDENSREEMRRRDDDLEREQQLERAGRLRRISMDLRDMTADDIEALGDDERVEAEVMRDEGRTVNYRA